MTLPVDVVVVSYRSGDRLRRALAPLAGVPGVRLIVVDNGPGDGSVDAVADLAPTVVEPGGNVGFARGCNAGARAGRNPWVLFLNPDARLEPASLARLAARLRTEPWLAVAAPRIEDEDTGEAHHSLQRDLRPATALALSVPLHRLTRARWATDVVRDPSSYVHPHEAEWASGACLLVRREAFEAVGGFHEGYWMYCEDADLCRTLREYGWGIGFEPSAVAGHEGGACAPRAALRPAYAQARLHYARRWDRAGSGRLAAVRAGLAARGLVQAMGRGSRADRAGELRGAIEALRPGAGRRPADPPAGPAPPAALPAAVRWLRELDGRRGAGPSAAPSPRRA